MKKNVGLIVLLVILGFLMIAPMGCCPSSFCSSKGQPGETPEEVRRRHKRIETIQAQERRADCDAFWLRDRASRLSNTVRIP